MKTAIIVLDALRKDYADRFVWPRLRAYGFQRIDNAVSPASWTLPTHASIVTGVYPIYHGAHHTKTGPKPIKSAARQLLVTKKLRSEIITGNGLIAPDFGFVGFEDIKYTCNVFLPPDPRVEKTAQRIFEMSGAATKIEKFVSLLRAGAIIVAFKKSVHTFRQLSRLFWWEIFTLIKGIPWPLEKDIDPTLEAIKNVPKSIEFLLINLSETHEPYHRWEFLDPSYVQRIYSSKVDKKRWKEGYKEAVTYLAKRIPEVIESLLERGFNRVIVTSDHGQLLGEHGWFGHDHFLFDELVRVPLYTLNIDVLTSRAGWITLADLKKAVIEGSLKERSIVFAESYKTREIKGEQAHIVPRYRVKVYSTEGIAVFDTKEWRWRADDFSTKSPPEETIIALKGAVMHFLKSGVVK